jgi:FtsP/CotA-like multicopper oxidase with cupredoxin domain
MKDVVLVRGFRKIAVDVTPAMDGLTLFHCHQQLRIDYGLSATSMSITFRSRRSL